MAHGLLAQGGLGAGGSVIPHDSSAHSVLVPDTELLFTAQFHRAGPDLVLTGRDGAHHLIPGYFSSEHHPALVAPNGAHLSPDTVDLLAGSAMPGHYAQAQPTAPPDSIGKIEKVVGDVTVVRNGVAVALHVGDAVFKSDVVATGSSSSCGISFPDGTALNLVANTRMALNDYAFDAGSNSNGALFTLVEGTFAFVAGKVAHQGDMKIATPVATMGIRGTTGVVQEQPDAPATITAQAAGHTYSFAVVPDIGTGITGMWDVYLTDANGIVQRDANGNPIVLATVSQSGYVTYLTPQGPGERPLVSVEPATNSQYAFEQQMLSDLFRTLNPANLNNNNSGGSSTQPPPFELPNPIPQLFEDSNKPFTINVPNGANPAAPATPTLIDIVVGLTGPLTVVIWEASGNGTWSSGPSWLGNTPPTSPQQVVIPDGHKVSTDGADSAAGLEVDGASIVNVVSGTSLTIYDFIHGTGTVQLNSTGSDPTLFIHGAVPLVGGGTIKMIGTAGQDFILGVPGTGAVLVNVDYTIEGTGTIGGGDGNLTFENFGTVNANDGLLTVNTGNAVYNDGLMEATVDPLAVTVGTLAIKDSVVNAGTVQADGAGAAVTLSGATFDNLFSVVAKNGGSITFTDLKVTNEAVSATDPAGGTINANGGTIAFDGGSIANGNLLEATNGGTLQLANLTVTNSAAGSATIDATSNLDLIGASILGGTIENDGSALVTGGASVLHGASVTNAGTMTVEAGASLTLEGDTTLTNEASGLIKADGAGATVSIELDTDTNVNSGIIEAISGGEVDFHVNVDGGSNHGLIEAGAGGTVHFFGHHGGGGGGGGDKGGNFGTMEAIDGGVLIFDGGIDNFDLVGAFNGGQVYLSNGIKNHAGTIDAAGSGSQIFISGGDQSENADQILAEHGGVISLASVVLQNDAMVEAASGGSISWITGGIDNFGIFSAGNNGTITFGGDIGITNEVGGKFEAALGGSIVFGASDTGSVNNNGGTIVATDGGTITFDSTLNGAENIDGGIIKAGTGGTIVIDGFQHGNALFNGGGTIEANGTGALVQLAGATIIGGTLQTSNSGLIETITNNGAATTTVFDGVTNEGYVLVNDNTSLVLRDTIHNGGTISLALSGQSDLKIDGTVTLLGGFVEMNTSGDEITALAAGASLINSGIIRGQGQIGGGDDKLTIAGSGVILADLAGKTLTIDTGNTVTDSGELSALSGGTLKIEDSINNYEVISSQGLGSDVELSGATLDNSGGSISADENGTMTLTDVAVTNENSGTISTFESGQIFFNGGSVTNNGSRIETLLNGSITFENGVSVTNDFAIIEALSGSITFDSSAGSVINKDGGVIEASLFGTIVFDAITVNNSGGTIEALRNISESDFNAAVDLNGTTINGGTLKTDSGGVIDALTGTSTFDGVTIAGGFIKAETGATVDLEDKTTISGTVTLEGGGTFMLDDPAQVASIVGGSGGGTLDIAAGATLAGAGNIGDGGTTTLALTNDGTIDANVADATLTIETGQVVTNTGTLEATHGGILEIDDNVCNIGGTIAAHGCGSVVALEGVTIKGGMFLTDGSTLGDRGVIEVANTDAATVFDGGSGHTVSIGGFVHVVGGASLALIGTVDLAAHGQNGTIDVDVIHFKDNPDIGADLVIHGTVTLSGAGAVVMEGDAAKITAAAPGAELHNDASISGAGSIGTGNDWLHLVNETHGVINADNASADNLTIATGRNTIVNHGLMEASCGGTLDIVSHVDNACGALLATSGGVLDVQSCISGGTATIHGATLEFDAASNVNVTFCNGSVDSPTYGTLVLGDPADFCGTIANFTGTCPDANHSDTIDLAGFKACNTTLHASYNGDDGITTLCVVDKTDDLSATLKLIGYYSTGNFTIASDDKGGIDIFDPPTTDAKDAPAMVTAAPGNEHTAAPAHQNAPDPVASPANEAGFGGDQSSVNVSPHEGDAAPLTNQLAPPAALGGDQPSDSAIETAFGIGHAGVDPVAGTANGNMTEADAGATITNTGSTQTLLSSLLNVLTDNTSPIAIVAPGTPVLDSEHLTDSTIVDGSGAANSEVAPSAPPTAPTNEHTMAPATVTPPSPAPSPTLASFGGMGSDNFAFHPNLGGATAQNTDVHASELAHNNVQISGPALASTAPEFHQEFAFDVFHQDAANLAAAVDQFHQMASNSTLLH
jgi:hypothetical protein